jgi:hypothetical protein
MKLKSDTKKSVNASAYKTKMCNNLLSTGKCIFGDKCDFAHNASELRTIKPNETCRYGDSCYKRECKMKHPNEEERNNNMLKNWLKFHESDENFRTVRCVRYESTRTCEYGDFCKFIHDDAGAEEKSDEDDEEELKQLIVLNDYKTMKEDFPTLLNGEVKPKQNIAVAWSPEKTKQVIERLPIEEIVLSESDDEKNKHVTISDDVKVIENIENDEKSGAKVIYRTTSDMGSSSFDWVSMSEDDMDYNEPLVFIPSNKTTPSNSAPTSSLNTPSASPLVKEAPKELKELKDGTSIINVMIESMARTMEQTTMDQSKFMEEQRKFMEEMRNRLTSLETRMQSFEDQDVASRLQHLEEK